MALQAALGPDLSLRWFETWSERWQIARVNSRATDIRLRIPETYKTHQRILDWNRAFSADKVPTSAIGLDGGTLKIMRWAMGDWSRMARLNRLPAATLAARVQMDFLTGLSCAAHVLISAPSVNLDTLDDGAVLLDMGAHLQRFWLTAESLGLAMQPSFAPLCFSNYARNGVDFTTDRRQLAQAAPLNAALAKLSASAPEHLLFLGRIGIPASGGPRPRSVRRPLSELLVRPSATN